MTHSTIDSAEITAITIDGTEVTEVTMDGTVVWTAGLAEIAAYLEDDWDDNALTSRTSPQDDVYAHPDANEAGDVLIGRYRPEWDIVVSGPTATNGYLHHDTANGNGELRTPSNHTTGEWSFDFMWESIGASGDKMTTYYMRDLSNNNQYHEWYEDSINGNELYRLYKVDSGSSTILIDYNWDGSTSWKSSRLTRDSYGNFEKFEDGASMATVTDSFLPNTETFDMRFSDAGGGASWRRDNLMVK